MNTENQNNKVVEITYNNLKFTVDFTKRGVPAVYYEGKLLEPHLNKNLNRYYFNIYLGKNIDFEVPGVHTSKNGYAWYNVYQYRIVAAGMEMLRTGEFDYEKFKGLQCDHINNNSSDDKPSNLRLTTRKRNNSRKHAREMRSRNYRNTRHENQIVRAVKNGEEKLFKNVMQCCKELGFSHVLGYRVINKTDYAKTARGWTLEWVPLTYGILENVQ